MSSIKRQASFFWKYPLGKTMPFIPLKPLAFLSDVFKVSIQPTSSEYEESIKSLTSPRGLLNRSS